ncbi:MAG: hypothetical protein ISR73_00655 [Gammaproteobacteria bacterium]|nr:hypothetical protein [Gammaproteobacteria bacterium]
MTQYLTRYIGLRHLALLCILAGLLVLSPPVQAEGDLMVLGASVLSGARDSKDGEYLLHLQGMYEVETSGVWSPTFGASILLDNEREYINIDSGVRSNFDAPLSPFVGFGFFISDAEYLQECPPDQQSEICQDPVVIGIYPEAGVHLWVGKRVRVSMFARAYLSNIRGPDDLNSVYGFNLAFTTR